MTSSESVIVGMSGGVDSSVAAKLLLDQGYQVRGLFMKNWEEDDGTEYCTAIEDLKDAQAVCDKLGIELHTANFSAEYWDNVFEHFLSEYRAGRTPNPDILCNREIKFNVFKEYADILGADKIATGHYVRMGTRLASTADAKPHPQLLKGIDQGKDQSYFLQSVSEEQLENCLFPVGHLQKAEVRRIAAEVGLVTHAKKDSTGICFIGERRFQDFLKQYIPSKPGKIMDLEGNTLGEHNGVMFYTLGQRQGLGIGGVKNQAEQPWYVVAKDVENNILQVAQGNQHKALFSSRLYCTEIAWIDGKGPELPSRLAAKTRYRQSDQVCHVEAFDAGYVVSFEEPQRAVTPGQWVCFYDGEVCLGGGIIESTGAPPIALVGELKGEIELSAALEK